MSCLASPSFPVSRVVSGSPARRPVGHRRLFGPQPPDVIHFSVLFRRGERRCRSRGQRAGSRTFQGSPACNAHTHIHTHTHTHTHILTFIHTHTLTHTSTCMHTYVRTNDFFHPALHMFMFSSCLILTLTGVLCCVCRWVVRVRVCPHP